MRTTVIDDKANLINAILADVDDNRTHVWRGQADVSWEPYPGLYRRLQANGYAMSEITEELIRQYELDLFCESNGLGYYGEVGGNRASLMIQLQHYGGATRLLDVTSNPFVALWFACQQDDVDGAVFCYSVDVRCHAMPEQIPTWDYIAAGDKHRGKPILFTPRKINERIKAQMGLFLTTSLKGALADGSVFTTSTSLISVKKVAFPAGLKAEVRSYLRVSFGIDEFCLYPDFQGYALANSAQSPFRRGFDELYDGLIHSVAPTPFTLDGVE